MSRKSRKQRVSLRFRRREQIKHHVRIALVRSVVVALVAGIGIGVAAGHDSVLEKFFRKHTPQVAFQLPDSLAGLPVITDLPLNRFWLWLPGSGLFLDKKLTRKYPAVRAVRLERFLDANRVIVHVEPRIPLVEWHGEGFDRDGVLFAMTPGTWKGLPQGSFSASTPKPAIGRWLLRLSEVTALWPQVAALKEDPYGTLEFTLKTGSVVIWGPLETEAFPRKAQTLVRVLDDAHTHLGGAARADLRFFTQGRIIVKPKSARG